MEVLVRLQSLVRRRCDFVEDGRQDVPRLWGSGRWIVVCSHSRRARGRTGVYTFFRGRGLRRVGAASGFLGPFLVQYGRGTVSCACGPLSPSIRASGAPCGMDGACLHLRLVGGLRAGRLLRCFRRSRGGRGRCLGVGAWVRRGAAVGVFVHGCGWWWVGVASGFPCVCPGGWLLRVPGSPRTCVLPANTDPGQPVVPGGPILNLLESSSSSAS